MTALDPRSVPGKPAANSPAGRARNTQSKSESFVLELFLGGAGVTAAALEFASPGADVAPPLGSMLELYGIEVTRYDDATVHDLAAELAAGRKVIATVDGDELRGRHPLLDAIGDRLGFESADRMVVVTGIDTRDPDNPRVLVDDPLSGEPIASVRMASFLDAWEDGGFAMVATHQPIPAHLPQMANFDYAAGHLPDVAGMEWSEFESCGDDPGAFSGWVHDGIVQQAAIEDGIAASGDEFSHHSIAALDPLTAQLLDDTDDLISETMRFIEEIEPTQGTGDLVGPDPAAPDLSGVSPSVRSTMGFLDGFWERTRHEMDVASRAAAGDEAAQAELEKINANHRRVTGMLEGMAESDRISSDVTRRNYEKIWKDQASQARSDAWSYDLEGQGHIESAADAAEGPDAGDAQWHLDRAESSFAKSDELTEWADDIDPDD